MMHWITPEIEQEMIAIRRELHQHPELAWQENRTAHKICEVLERCGIPYRSGVAKTGVVADIPGRKDGPIIALRADMDALPLQEETGLGCTSQVPGVMHACGHDGHITILLGVAMALTTAKEQHTLPVRLLFQPAEEVAGGARAMIKEGVLDGVAMIFGAHLDCNHAVGKVVIGDGAVTASRDLFRIEITGKGGHAARPSEAIDAIMLGSMFIQKIHSLTAGKMGLARPAVVSIGCFKAGTAANVIAETAVLDGTIYAQDEKLRAELKESIRQIAKSISDTYKAQIEVEIERGIPAIINQAQIAQMAREVAYDCLGTNSVEKSVATNMGAEDFSCFLEHVAGCYVRIGAWNGADETAPAHSSRFNFDEGALVTGASYLTSLAIAAGKRC
ncbi:MAG: M20 family metallopeptidase [Gammaproteobacteria bacterium]